MKELSLHILDIVQNSLKAGATEINIAIMENTADNTYIIEVEDNGCGMDSDALAKASNPFYTTRVTRNVGLGIPLLREAAERCNGYLKIESQKGKGTKLRCVFERNNIDRAPLGNIGDTIMTIVNSLNECELKYNYFFNNSSFSFSTDEVIKIVGKQALKTSSVLLWIKEYINDGMKNMLNNSKS